MAERETNVQATVDRATANLTETISKAEVRTKGKNNRRLDVQYVEILDPVTGRTLGASDFLSKTTDTFQFQADATISQANPVSTTLYEVLPVTTNVRILGIAAVVTWAVTQPTPLEVIVTLDGQTLTFIQLNPISGSNYYCRMRTDLANDALIFSTDNSYGDVFRAVEGRSVRVQVRVTWAVTQPTPLVCRVKYERRS